MATLSSVSIRTNNHKWWRNHIDKSEHRRTRLGMSKTK